jgi:hypothetical protein
VYPLGERRELEEALLVAARRGVVAQVETETKI